VVDKRVLEAQRWVNSTYGSVSGYQRCDEDGITGWTTIYSPVRGREGVGLVRSDVDLFPLQHVCVWHDGTQVEEVPRLVNPIIVSLAAVGVVGFAAFVGASVHESRTGPTAAGRRPVEHELGSRRGSD
jgi:hypothetical protein